MFKKINDSTLDVWDLTVGLARRLRGAPERSRWCSAVRRTQLESPLPETPAELRIPFVPLVYSGAQRLSGKTASCLAIHP